jgi:hypothetical protein
MMLAHRLGHAGAIPESGLKGGQRFGRERAARHSAMKRSIHAHILLKQTADKTAAPMQKTKRSDSTPVE